MNVSVRGRSAFALLIDHRGVGALSGLRDVDRAFESGTAGRLGGSSQALSPDTKKRVDLFPVAAGPSGRKRAVFLDRDGVINRAIVRDGKPYPPNSLGEFVILEDVQHALVSLKQAGFLLIVVTNQPDVARGKQSIETVEVMNRKLTEQLPLDEILVCYHSGEDSCSCRKPSPGLLLNAATRHNLDLQRSYMIGDRWRDVEAGQNAGCVTIFVDRGYSEKQPARPPDYQVTSLGPAAQWILSREAPEIFRA